MARNLLGVLPKLTPQEGNEIVFKLKCFRCEHYQTLRYDDVRQLGLLNLDEVRAALRMWGTASSELLSKLESES
jgi:hypothetical protein